MSTPAYWTKSETPLFEGLEYSKKLANMPRILQHNCPKPDFDLAECLIA